MSDGSWNLARPLLRAGPEVCGDLAQAAAREWLETDGLGGYAASTVAGLNTRRYHGLLVAATKPPVGRAVLLSKLEETLVVAGERFELSVNRYPERLHPEGHRFLAEFRLDPFPVWVFAAGGLLLEKSLFMVRGESTTVVGYRLLGPGEATLEVLPLIAFRDHHALTAENGALDPAVTAGPGRVRVAPYPGLPPLEVAHDGEVSPTGHWHLRLEYDEERRRGHDFREDLFQPFRLVFRLRSGESAGATLIASTRAHAVSDVHRLRGAELARRVALTAQARSADGAIRLLTRAADQFLAAREELTTVIAGYPWFADWGRDAMISLAGLTLATDRPDTARRILLAYSRHAAEGLLPNRFPDDGGPAEPGSVDASLWFVEAVRRFVEATGGAAWVREHLWETLLGIAGAYADGLLSCGEPGTALTWMDARVAGEAVTPRRGKPVEIQALWHNALRTLAGLAARFGDPERAALFGRRAAQAAEAFRRLFWNETAGALFDVVAGDARDPSIRPNQILAVSLPHPLLDAASARKVLDVVTRELLTPYGLRTLSPADPRYASRYEGDPSARDRAYHQGAAWPWLMGPYVDAFLRVHGRGPDARRRARALLAPLAAFVEGPGTGQLPELFDGDAPHRPGGCPAQAWSVAEVLR
ncbi:MAG TPA: amylo-alpha-1,6-glucosidase, partial [Thermoanaerobaculia bacterium]|nr:amylo-alpha-1,6-glucosidase [Thermoanaerobaculia bacterium]